MVIATRIDGFTEAGVNYFLEKWGYSDALPVDIKATYLINILSMCIMYVYSPVYFFVFENKRLSMASFFVGCSLLGVLMLLKSERHFQAKNMLVIILLFQTAVMSTLWLDKDSGMNYFFFTFTPASFVLYDIKVFLEKKIIIAINIASSTLLVISEIITVEPLVQTSAGVLTAIRSSCILITLGVILYVYSFFINDLELLHAKLRQKANTDELTGLGNRRVLFEAGRRIFARGSKQQYALLIFDIDRFKAVNDTYGHPAGDEVLKALSGLVTGSISRSDIITRFGGEEFAVILRNVVDTEALEIAQRLRQTVEAQEIQTQDGRLIQITISIGLTCYSDELQSFDEMIRRSDIALYRAKDSGRNRVVVYE